MSERLTKERREELRWIARRCIDGVGSDKDARDCASGLRAMCGALAAMEAARDAAIEIANAPNRELDGPGFWEKWRQVAEDAGPSSLIRSVYNTRVREWRNYNDMLEREGWAAERGRDGR